ncbi:MAG: HD-GYP domain-containing protein [Phycisphaeraceae bacterium]|nr:HD-GYP domain-containing protein [Phycisphaeraceae bacterium]
MNPTSPSPTIPPPPTRASSALFDAARDRCRAQSLAVWRADTAGTLVAEPDEPGLAGLWLRSGTITSLISTAARELAGQAAPQLRELFPGCWLVPIIHEARRRRTALTLAVALSPAALDAQTFRDACAASGLDLHATRLTMRKVAVFDAAGVQRAASALQWMVNDLAALTEHTDVVQGFTNELTQSYETIDLLYALGRSMLDLNNPERFIALVCDRLHETLPFGYLACQFVNEPKLVGQLAGRLLSRGTLPNDPNQITSAMSRLLTRPAGEIRGFLAADANDAHAQDRPTEGRILVQPVTLDGKLAAVIICGNKHGEDPQVNSYDMQLIEAASGYTGAFLENARLVRNQQAMFMGTLQALTAAIDAKDRYTCGHSERVAHLASRLALASGHTPEQAERIHISGLVHDVGKIGVPEAVLCKPGRLTDDEFALIKLHPEIGHRILKDIPMLEDVLPAVLHHHERYDGRGYPHGLSGQAIPLAARIMCLADTFDAMSSNRAYRPAMPRAKVLEEIARCAGTQFDPDLARVFVAMDFSTYDAMVAQHAQQYGPQRVVLAAA